MLPSFSPKALPIGRSVTPVRVLVMDAEPLVRWSICTALASEGFDPVGVGDAAGARRVAAEWPPPRIAVLDLGSSETECLDILTSLRAFYPACRCVVITTSRHRTLPAPFAGSVQIIHKPFDLDHVIGVVRELTASKEAQGGSSHVSSYDSLPG